MIPRINAFSEFGLRRARYSCLSTLTREDAQGGVNVLIVRDFADKRSPDVTDKCARPTRELRRDGHSSPHTFPRIVYLLFRGQQSCPLWHVHCIGSNIPCQYAKRYTHLRLPGTVDSQVKGVPTAKPDLDKPLRLPSLQFLQRVAAIAARKARQGLADSPPQH